MRIMEDCHNNDDFIKFEKVENALFKNDEMDSVYLHTIFSCSTE